MMKKVTLLAFALCVLGCLAWAAEGTWVGVVSDSNCGLKHSAPSDEAAACVKKCVEGGGKYVLVHRGKVYNLDAQEKFADYAGKRVKVAGTLSGDSITVTSVEAAPGRKKAAKEGTS